MKPYKDINAVQCFTGGGATLRTGETTGVEGASTGNGKEGGVLDLSPLLCMPLPLLLLPH